MLLNYCFKNYALILVVVLFHLHICYTPNNFSVVCAQENISREIRFKAFGRRKFWSISHELFAKHKPWYFEKWMPFLNAQPMHFIFNLCWNLYHYPKLRNGTKAFSIICQMFDIFNDFFKNSVQLWKIFKYFFSWFNVLVSMVPENPLHHYSHHSHCYTYFYY